MGLYAAINSAGRSLETFSAGIQVAGQNVANANTPGYIREALLLEPADAFQKGDLIFGTGVRAAGIRQQIDLFLERRIHAANTDLAASEARDAVYRQLQNELRELGDADLSTALNDFLATIHDVANQPESESLRQVAVQEGQQLAQEVSQLRLRVDELRRAQNIRVNSLVEEANRLIAKIEELNPQISHLEAAGLLASDAGALRSQRYEALNRLAEIVPIRFRENKDGSVDVFTGNDFLILPGQSQRLETVTSTDRKVTVDDVQLTTTKSPLSMAGGELAGIIQGRDEILGGFVDELDKYAASLIFEFNRIHSSGEGLQGYTKVAAANGVDDPNAVLTDAGLKFTPEHGSFQVKLRNTLTGVTTTTIIDVDLDGIDPASDTTLEGLRQDLDAVANLNATVTPDGRLTLTTDAGFEVRFAADSSGVLAALGINTFFTGFDSDTIDLDPRIASDQALLATSQGGGPGDGRNAVELAGFIENPVPALANQSLNTFYDRTVSALAQSAASENTLKEGFAAFRESLFSQRQQFSGVSLDEEAINILEFQRAFQAAARLISTIDELFTTLLNI